MVDTEKGVGMSEFTITLEGQQAGEQVSPQNAPLKEVKETLEALYKLINDTADQPEQAVVSFRKGSLQVVMHPPTSTAIYLADALATKRPRAEEPYMAFINTLERTSRRSGLTIKVLRDDIEAANITPEKGANLNALQPRWVKTTLTISGEIVNMGGRNPNVHLVSDHTGETHIIAIDKKTVQALHLYRRYVFDVSAEQAFGDRDKLRNLRYRSHLEVGERMSLADFIRQEGPKWEDVVDADAWVSNLRGDRELN